MVAKKPSWKDVDLAPVVLLKGKEELLIDRAVSRLRKIALKNDPQVEINTLEASNYQLGQLSVYTSPSLFQEKRLVIVNDLENLSPDLLNDLLKYVEAPQNDVNLILKHGGGVRGKKLLDRISKLGFPVVLCEGFKNVREKLAFVNTDVKALGGRIEPEAAQFLVDALGTDLAELSGAVSQLVSDMPSIITLTGVKKYYGGRLEANGYKVADMAVSGNPALALATLRQAYNSGVSPVVIVAALASKIRLLAKISSPTDRNLSLPPWQLQKARQEVRYWSDRALAQAIRVIAQADHEVKGASRDPYFAAERAVRRIAQLRG